MPYTAVIKLSSPHFFSVRSLFITSLLQSPHFVPLVVQMVHSCCHPCSYLLLMNDNTTIV